MRPISNKLETVTLIRAHRELCEFVAAPFMLGVQTAFGSPLLFDLNSFTLNGWPGKNDWISFVLAFWKPFVSIKLALHLYNSLSNLQTRKKFSQALKEVKKIGTQIDKQD